MSKGKSADDQEIANVLQKTLDRTIAKSTRPNVLLAGLIEKKFVEAGVRITRKERESIRQSTQGMIETNDLSQLKQLIRRRRHINITITSEDVEKYGEAMLHVVERSTDSTIDRLSRMLSAETAKWAEQSIRWTATIREGFEERLEKTWSRPFFLYSRYMQLTAYVGHLASARFHEEGLNSSRLYTAMLLLHVRAYAIASEIEVLMRAGYADGAAARWRTLHEVAVTMSFLSNKGEDAAQRYLAHWPCEHLRGLKLYEEHRKALGDDSTDDEFKAELEAEVEALKEEYGKEFASDFGWAAKALELKKVTFKELEGAVDLTKLRPYYRLASEQVHASSRGVFARQGLIAEGPADAIPLAGPSNYGFSDTAANTASSLLLATASLNLVALTVDTAVYTLILMKWIRPLGDSFAKVQAGIERREERLQRMTGAIRGKKRPKKEA